MYQGLVHKQPGLTSLTIRCQSKRIPRPTTIIPPLPNLRTLVVYDIDPLCYPDDISLLLVGSKKLENLKLHWSPRMRDTGEESVNLMAMFGRCVAARYSMPLKRVAMYNLYTRFPGDGMETVIDPKTQEEAIIINTMGSSDPMTVFLDEPWRRRAMPVPHNLKMLCTDDINKENAEGLGRLHGVERLYFVSKRRNRDSSKATSSAATPISPQAAVSGPPSGTVSASGTPNLHEKQCRSLGGEYLAVIQANHRNMRHLLLSEKWQLSDDALFRLCQSCPNLEQLAFASTFPHLGSLRQIISMLPKLWAVRMLIQPGSPLAEKVDSMDDDMHRFAIATEFWRPEYKNIRYLGMGDDLVWKLGGVYFPSKDKEPMPEGQENSMNAKRAGPIRKLEVVSRESVKHVEIWGMDTVEFDPKFP